MHTAAGSELIVRREGSAGRITLNRPEALNALTLAMIRGMGQALDAFEADPAVATVILDGAGARGFCAGGDIRALYDQRTEGAGFAETYWREEYRLDLRIAKFSKPLVVFLHGIVMGGGAGISMHARHRIVTDTTAFAMPECGIGFMPDVGATWLLPRAPGETGTWLALTGERIGAADAIFVGVADRFMPQGDIEKLMHELTSAEEADASECISRFAQEPGPSELARRREEIDRCFVAEGMEPMIERLEAADTEFARKTLEALRQKSPTSLKLTLAAQRRGRALGSLAECLDMEYRIVLRLFAGHDFHEGIRAAVIDKDRSPHWRPPALEDVTEAMVESYFAPLGALELGLAGERVGRPEARGRKAP